MKISHQKITALRIKAEHQELKRLFERDDEPNEREDLAAGLSIVRDYVPDGESDFDKGMRLLQQKLGVNNAKRHNEKFSDGAGENHES